jgi:hypothetical protein
MTRREIAEQLLGAALDENGFAPCPGESRHTKKSGRRDFRVILDAAPTGFCFHSACAEVVANFNAVLRDRIRIEENRGGAARRPAFGVTAREPKAAVVARPKINQALVESFTHGVPAVIDEAWVTRRSPVDPATVTPGIFCDSIFEPGEKVLIFTSQYSQGDFLWWCGRGGFRLSPHRGVKAVPSDLPKGGKDGVFYLSQPVSGRWEVKPDVKWNPQASAREVRGMYTRRSEQNVTGWRHFVFESDELDASTWLRVLAAIDLPIVAIYTSGGRSIHAIVRSVVESKAQWDATARVLRQVLCPLGADPAALTAVRLSRLPGCLRGEKMQRLLFLNPSPSSSQKLFLLPEIR